MVQYQPPAADMSKYCLQDTEPQIAPDAASSVYECVKVVKAG